jgi:hypothetical protein
MPAVITPAGSPTFPSSLTVPTAGDSVSAGAATPMRVAYQGLLDGLQFLNLLTGTTGVKRLREVATGAALKALTGMATGDLAFVTDTGGVFGLYRFKTESPLGADIADWAYAATSGTGNWYNISSTLMVLGGAGGTSPRLDEATIRAPFTPPGVPTTTQNTTSYPITMGSAPGILFGPTLSLSLQTGDVVMLDAFVLFSKATSTGYGLVRLNVDGASVAGSDRYWTADGGASAQGLFQNLDPMGLYTATSTASVSVQLRYVSDAAAGIASLLNPQLRALVIRP